MKVERKIQDAWDFIFDKLFCKKTKLIYDYRTDESENGAFAHLPTKDEIARNYPNPCGWFTGMEDSDINGGIMLDAVICRYEVTKDEKIKELANDLYEGLMLNATVSEQKGFLARARHPEDGITHYINSSRDQYTHWIYSMLRFYQSELSNSVQREAIKRVLIEFAEKAERDITEENGYCLLNEENKPSLVGDMRGENVVWHEALRGAMFYIAAYAVTKDEHWLEKYREERAWGLDYSEQINFAIFKNAFALMQMQLSVRLCYDYEEESEYKARYKKLMEKVADFSKCYIFEAQKELKDFEVPKTTISWRNCPSEYVSRKISKGYEVIMNEICAAVCGEKYHVYRNAGECLIIQLLCTERKIDKAQVEAFESIVERISLSNTFHCDLVAYCLTWWMLKQAIFS